MAADLSIVIPNWNGGAVLAECLQSIADARGDLELEVILYDNGSTDGSIPKSDENVDGFSLLVLEGPTNVGFAEACNRASELASAEIILVLNTDTLIRGSLEEAVSYFARHPDIGIAQGPLLSADGTRIDSVGSLITRSGFLVHLLHAQVLSTGTATSTATLPASRDIFAAKGAAIYIRRAVIDAVGLFDSDAFAYFEDSDLCWRAWLAGWRVRYSSRLPIVHHVGGVAASHLARPVIEFHSFKNRLRSIMINASPVTLCVMLPAHAVLCATAVLAQIYARQTAAAASIGHAWLWNVRHWRTTRVRRSAVQAQRVVSDREIFKRVLVRLPFLEFARIGRLYQRAAASYGGESSDSSIMRESDVMTNVDPGHSKRSGRLRGSAEAVNWDALARLDPLWAVLSEPERKHGGWAWDDFASTGHEQVAWLLERSTTIGRPVRRNRALDFGSGVGRMTAALAAHFGEVVGVDISRVMIDVAKGKHADLENLYFIVATHQDLDRLPAASFDLVVSDRVLQHQHTHDDIVAAISGLFRITRDDGLLCFQLPHRLGLGYQLFARWRPYEALRRTGVSADRLYRWFGLHPMRLKAMGEKRVVALLEELGACVLHVDREYGCGHTYFVGKRSGDATNVSAPTL